MPLIFNIAIRKNMQFIPQLFEYGGLDEILKLFDSVNRNLSLVLDTTQIFLNHLLINPENKLVILEKVDEFMMVSKLQELCDHPRRKTSNIAFDILSLCGIN